MERRDEPRAPWRALVSGLCGRGPTAAGTPRAWRVGSGQQTAQRGGRRRVSVAGVARPAIAGGPPSHRSRTSGHRGRASGHRSRTSRHRGRASGRRSRESRHRGRVSGRRSRESGHRGRASGHRSRASGHRGRAPGRRSRESGHRGRASGHRSREFDLAGGTSGFPGPASGVRRRKSHSGRRGSERRARPPRPSRPAPRIVEMRATLQEDRNYEKPPWGSTEGSLDGERLLAWSESGSRTRGRPTCRVSISPATFRNRTQPSA